MKRTVNHSQLRTLCRRVRKCDGGVPRRGSRAKPYYLSVLALLALCLGQVVPSGASAQPGVGPSMICVVEGMGSRISEGTLCHKLERMLGMTMVRRADPWARDAVGTVRVIGGDVDILVAVAWRKHRIAWARRSWMELGSSYVSTLGMTVRELLPRLVVKKLTQVRSVQTQPYRPLEDGAILRSEIIDPWVLSRMPTGAGLLPWEAEKKSAKKRPRAKTAQKAGH